MTRLLASVLLPAAIATAPPVGPLPKGPVFEVNAKRGAAFQIALPAAKAGYAWRIARPFDGHVVQEVAEGDRGGRVWIRFRAVRPGTTRIVLALTLGERTKAYRARTYRVTVRA